MKKRKSPTKEELIELHITQRMSVVQMAKHYKTSFTKVSAWLKECGIEQQVNRPRGHTFTKTKLKYAIPPEDELRSHIELGKTNQEIEQIYGVSNSVLKNWYKKHGIERAAYDGTLTPIPTYNELYTLHISERLTVAKIAKKLNTSYQKVTEWLRFYNIEQKLYQPKRKVFLTKEQLERYHIKDKLSFKEIARGNEISDVAVGLLAKEHGIENINYGIGQDSINERLVREFIQQYYASADRLSLKDDLNINKRKKTVSYDIVIPEIKLIVEYNGLYFHNESKIDPNRHVDKMRLAHHHGYSIINIFSDEWIYKQDIVKSMLRYRLKVVPNRIFARNTTIKSLTDSEANKFYDENHIQGRSSYYTHSYGLVHNNELVAAMSFGRHHRINNNEIILKRFATKLNTNVIGGASKLFSHFKNTNEDVDRVKSWSDNRWSEGKLYETLGFIHTADVEKRYSYVYPNETRRSAQSHTKKLIGCPPEITERDFLYMQNIYRIWDCGKKVWEWKRGA